MWDLLPITTQPRISEWIWQCGLWFVMGESMGTSCSSVLTMLILPAAVCLSQRLSHAVASASFSTARLGMARKLSCRLRSGVPTWKAVVILELIRAQRPALQVRKCGFATDLVEAILARMASHNSRPIQHIFKKVQNRFSKTRIQTRFKHIQIQLQKKIQK